MTDAQVADIVRQVTEGVAAQLAAQLKRIESGQDRIRKALKLHDLKADGIPEANYPWLKLDRMRRIQVEDVLRFMREHKFTAAGTNTIPNACRATWKPIRNGYPNANALANYCYSVMLTDYV